MRGSSAQSDTSNEPVGMKIITYSRECKAALDEFAVRDFYFTWDYHELEARRLSGRPCFLVYESPARSSPADRKLQLSSGHSCATRWTKCQWCRCAPACIQYSAAYTKAGFKSLNQPLGNTGHCFTDAWFLLDLFDAS